MFNVLADNVIAATQSSNQYYNKLATITTYQNMYGKCHYKTNYENYLEAKAVVGKISWKEFSNGYENLLATTSDKEAAFAIVVTCFISVLSTHLLRGEFPKLKKMEEVVKNKAEKILGKDWDNNNVFDIDPESGKQRGGSDHRKYGHNIYDVFFSKKGKIFKQCIKEDGGIVKAIIHYVFHILSDSVTRSGLIPSVFTWLEEKFDIDLIKGSTVKINFKSKSGKNYTQESIFARNSSDMLEDFLIGVYANALTIKKFNSMKPNKDSIYYNSDLKIIMYTTLFIIKSGEAVYTLSHQNDKGIVKNPFRQAKLDVVLFRKICENYMKSFLIYRKACKELKNERTTHDLQKELLNGWGEM